MNWMIFLYIAGGLMLLVAAVVIVLSLPDVLRYIRISKM